ncbi:MAG TPA: hypothetical protein PLE77_05595 [Kiritimatiellia bacterium]|nr:hypothetical protein [Kiritimatiellia bacterium]
MSLIQEALRRKDDDDGGDKNQKAAAPVTPAVPPAAPKLSVKAPAKRSVAKSPAKMPAKVMPSVAEGDVPPATAEQAPEVAESPSGDKKPASRMGLVIGVSVGAAVVVIGAFAAFMLLLDKEPENELVVPSRSGTTASRPQRTTPSTDAATAAPAQPAKTESAPAAVPEVPVEPPKPRLEAVPQPAQVVAPSVTVEVAVSPQPKVEPPAPAVQPASPPPPAAPAEKKPAPAPVQKAAATPAPAVKTPAAAVAPAADTEPVEEPAPPPEIKWPHLKVVGTMAGRGGGSAIINGTIVSVDERMEGVRLLEVSQTACVFEYQGETQMVRVGQTTW